MNHLLEHHRKIMRHATKWGTIILVSFVCVMIMLAPQGRLNEHEESPEYLGLAVPALVVIERIGVHAAVEAVGAVQGAMGSPRLPTDVSWYRDGVSPGQEGSAVFAGHVNWSGGQDAVFTNLHALEMGDQIIVVSNYGVRDYFTVTDLKRYPAQGDSEQVFLSHDGRAHLNLITCDGVWNAETKTHESRLVVFAEKV